MVPDPPTPVQPLDDEALLARLQQGDALAFEQLVRAFTPRLLPVARRILQNEEDARDALQDGLISAYRSVGRFEGRSRPSGLWGAVVGGRMGGACGVVDGGSSLYFSAAGTRLLRTVELDTTGIR